MKTYIYNKTYTVLNIYSSVSQEIYLLMLTEEIELKIHMYFNVILVNCVCAHVCVKASTDLILEAAFGSDVAVFDSSPPTLKHIKLYEKKTGEIKQAIMCICATDRVLDYSIFLL